MDYYFLSLNACGEFDDETLIINKADNRHVSAKNIGLIFDWWPLDDLFYSHPEIFCTERLKALWVNDYRKFTGMEFMEIPRISTGANWRSNYQDARPGNYWHISAVGTPLIDDFAVFSDSNYIIASQRAVNFFLQNHATEIHGEKIDKALADYFEDYKKRMKESNFMYTLPKITDRMI